MSRLSFCLSLTRSVSLCQSTNELLFSKSAQSIKASQSSQLPATAVDYGKFSTRDCGTFSKRDRGRLMVPRSILRRYVRWRFVPLGMIILEMIILMWRDCGTLRPTIVVEVGVGWLMNRGGPTVPRPRLPLPHCLTGRTPTWECRDLILICRDCGMLHPNTVTVEVGVGNLMNWADATAMRPRQRNGRTLLPLRSRVLALACTPYCCCCTPCPRTVCEHKQGMVGTVGHFVIHEIILLCQDLFVSISETRNNTFPHAVEWHPTLTARRTA